MFRINFVNLLILFIRVRAQKWGNARRCVREVNQGGVKVVEWLERAVE